jgi:hypothetical protein
MLENGLIGELTLLYDWRLDLLEVIAVEIVPDILDDASPGPQDLNDFLVHNHVKGAIAEPLFLVLEAEVL